MSNPNNCLTCKHNNVTVDGEAVEGHCYMFEEEPSEVCMQHTMRQQKVAFINHGRPSLLGVALAASMLIAQEIDDER